MLEFGGKRIFWYSRVVEHFWGTAGRKYVGVQQAENI
jgi:hypothetical protein